MKTFKYILSVWTILSLSILCYSCMDEEIPKSSQTWCDGKTLVLNLNAPATQIISPMTKSAQKDTVMTDLNVLIYKNGQLTEGFYYNETNSPELLSALKRGEEKQLDIVLGKDAKGTVYAVANYGTDIYADLNGLGDDKAKFETATSLEAATFPLKDKQPVLYMYAKGGDFDVSSASSNKIGMNLERIYAMVTVMVDKQGLQKPPGSGTFDIELTSVQIKNIPTQGQFRVGNLIGTNNVGCDVDGEMFLNSESEGKEKFLETKHDAAQPFYLYENRQPEGSSLNNNTDQTTKTPHGLPADEIISIIKQNRTCTYIEVHGKYVRNGNPEGVGSGTIIYRFFLGKDIYKNFDIERNTHYRVTLTLKGKGGADEATWRVETSLIGDVQAPDVYIGYRAGSKTRMYITGTGIEYITAVSAKITHKPAGGSDRGFIVSEVKSEKLGDGSERYYVDIEADATNTHDYDKKIGQVTFSVDGNGVKKDFTAKVYQVPRLVDPIAFYKKADNIDPVHIQVKEFDQNATPSRGAYVNLVSKGAWTAKIKESSASGSNWYRIYKTDEQGNEIPNTSGSSLDYEISGEGPVQFGYQPLSVNGEADGDGGTEDKARYGMIQVKYHNDWCEHEIFLRQGYQPTSLGDDNYAWSLFNVGKEGNTTSPTQTGWLFNGGVNIGLHPFIPGHGTTDADKNAPVEYADGSKGMVGMKGASSSAWNNNQQGPCPPGYFVPQAQVYRNMVSNTTVYTGYVYDDDPDAGWWWGTDGDAKIDESMHCNPAKGSLFVEKSGKLCKNLFFNYGKGVLTGVRAGRNDNRLVEEIGIGHRYNPDCRYGGGLLSYSDYAEGDNTYAYGGFYWNGSQFPGQQHMGKVDFGYNIFSREPSLIDVPGQPASEGGGTAQGIDGLFNASFVRCVRQIDRTYMINTVLKAGTKFSATFTENPYQYIYVRVNGNRTQIPHSNGWVTSDVPISCKSDASVVFELGGYSITIKGSKIAEIENTTSYRFGPGTYVVIE